MKITIQEKSDYIDCECCGSYETREMVITDGTKTLELYYDGHFGGGNWNAYDENDTIAKIVEFLGHEVEFKQ